VSAARRSWSVSSRPTHALRAARGRMSAAWRASSNMCGQILSLVLGRVSHQPADLVDLEPPARLRSWTGRTLDCSESGPVASARGQYEPRSCRRRRVHARAPNARLGPGLGASSGAAPGSREGSAGTSFIGTRRSAASGFRDAGFCSGIPRHRRTGETRLTGKCVRHRLSKPYAQTTKRRICSHFSSGAGFEPATFGL
jgi:hypothetical protein